MSHVLYRKFDHDYPVAVRGAGIEIIDRDGKRYIDASGGAAVSCLGHSHPRVIEAVRRQVQDLAFAHSSFFTNEPAEALADHLIASAPAGLDKVFFVSGGSEAVEAALKMARQYFVEIGQPERRRFIARRQSYHGNTLGALSVGGNPWRRRPYEPLLLEVEHVSPCYAYRGREPGESDRAYVQRLLREFEDTIVRVGPETVIAFVAEPVVGATMGAVPALPGYFPGIRALCDRYGILLILDEVMCGMGRTGSLFASEQEGVDPDIVTIAKGLGAGYQPIGATLASATICEAIRKGTGFFQHGHTYMAHPVACAAGLAVQEALASEQLLGRVRSQGARLNDLLRARLDDHPHVGDVRGRGLFMGVELVADRATKRPFDPKLKLNAVVKAAAMERGLLCYAMGGTIDGRHGDHLLLAPPYIVTDAELEEIVERLGDAIDAALGQVRAGA
jgi:adenosylmethionine-8-amino-7-oxononanoate aminotransferase